MSSFYASTVRHIQHNVEHLNGAFHFLADYNYDLDSDQLTNFGRREMMHSGTAFHERYRELADQDEPFVRASGSDRVVESADLFLTGYYRAQQTSIRSSLKRVSSRTSKSDIYRPAYPVVVIPESATSNNT